MFGINKHRSLKVLLHNSTFKTKVMLVFQSESQCFPRNTVLGVTGNCSIQWFRYEDVLNRYHDRFKGTSLKGSALHKDEWGELHHFVKLYKRFYCRSVETLLKDTVCFVMLAVCFLLTFYRAMSCTSVSLNTLNKASGGSGWLSVSDHVLDVRLAWAILRTEGKYQHLESASCCHL